jgi:spore maturation protein CgeB
MGAEGIRCQADRDILLASNSEQFIQQANKLITQPELAQSIEESAEKLITKYYSWQSQLQPLVNLLNSEGKQ